MENREPHRGAITAMRIASEKWRKKLKNMSEEEKQEYYKKRDSYFNKNKTKK